MPLVQRRLERVVEHRQHPLAVEATIDKMRPVGGEHDERSCLLDRADVNPFEPEPLAKQFQVSPRFGDVQTSFALTQTIRDVRSGNCDLLLSRVVNRADVLPLLIVLSTHVVHDRTSSLGRTSGHFSRHYPYANGTSTVTKRTVRPWTMTGALENVYFGNRAAGDSAVDDGRRRALAEHDDHGAASGPERTPTGIAGLDEILGGGLPAQRVHLLEGDPGTGKTTLALQFLLDGVARGETCLYVSLSETAHELRGVAQSHGWTLDGLILHELTPSEGVLTATAQYSLFHPSEVELSDTIKGLIDQVTEHNPSRIVIDSLSEMRVLASEAVRYRRQILALKQFFVGRGATVILIDDRAGHRGDLQVQSISHGVIRLEQRTGEYGSKRRRLEVVKLRGVNFRDGYHDFRIATGGVRVLPRLVAADHRSTQPIEPIPSGIEGLDRLLGGGLSSGTCAIIIGPAGVGKTSLASQYAAAFARSGGRAAIYLLDERLNTFTHRTRRLGLNLEPLVRSGQILVEQWDPDQVTPGQFATAVRARVEDDQVGVVLIDSLNGLLNSMRNVDTVLAQLHELLSYLNEKGVLTILIVAQHGVLGSSIAAPIDVSYLADTVIMLRFFEANGAVHKAISVVKKRTGGHERTIREFDITDTELRVGEPLKAFRGVLTGVPQYTGTGEPLFDATDGDGAGHHH